MRRPEERADRILQHLRNDGKLGCPVCGQTRFEEGPERYERNASGKMVVTGVCSHCGYAMTFAVGKLPDARR